MKHLDAETLALMAGGDLGQREASAAAEHAAACERCGIALREFREAVAEFRGWAAETAGPSEHERQAVRSGVWDRLSRKRQWDGMPGVAAAAAAVVVICGTAAVWVGRTEQAPGREGPDLEWSASARGTAVAGGVNSRGDAASAEAQPKAREASAHPAPQRLVARRGGGRVDTSANAARHGPASRGGALAGPGPNAVAMAHGARGRNGIAGARDVSLLHDAEGEPMLEIATANPNVVIFWYVDERSRKNDGE